MGLRDKYVGIFLVISFAIAMVAEIMYAHKSKKELIEMEDKLKDEVKTSKSVGADRYSNNRTFTVISKDNNEMYEVFDIIYDKAGYPHFLIYKNNAWVRQSAKHFYPLGYRE